MGTFLSNVFCCLLFQLRVFFGLIFSLPFLCSFWLRVSHGSVNLGFALCFLRLLVVLPVPLISCVFLGSTLNLPNLDQRPGFFVSFTWASGASWWLGDYCSAGSVLFVFVTTAVCTCATLSNMKIPLVVWAWTWPAVLSLDEYCSSLQTWGVGVFHLRASFTHLLLTNPYLGMVAQCTWFHHSINRVLIKLRLATWGECCRCSSSCEVCVVFFSS